jgi:hypothetical protein
MRALPSVPTIVTGQGIPSFLWLLCLLLLCSSSFGQPLAQQMPQSQFPATATPAAAWLLAGSLALLCAALSLFSLRREKEYARA